MTKDCQCHRLFYPTLIRSCCSSNYVTSLKTKTTISPVITTLRTIGVIQRKKRKSEHLLLRSKLSKHSYTTNQPDTTSPQNLFEYDYYQPKQGISFVSQPQSFRLVSNAFLVGLMHYNPAPRSKQAYKSSKRNVTAGQPEMPQGCPNSPTSSHIRTDYNRAASRLHANADRPSRDPERTQASRRSRIPSANSSGEGRRIAPGQGRPSTSDGSPRPAGFSDDREQFIFTMSPFSSTHTLSTFLRPAPPPPESFTLVTSKPKTAELADESDELDQDEHAISITSVLPIDIPQSHKSC